MLRDSNVKVLSQTFVGDLPAKERMNGTVRIIYATDLHLWHNNPANRTVGSYAEDLLTKTKYIYEYAMMNDADLVIWGGDLTNRPQIPPMIANPFLALTGHFCLQGGHVLFQVGEHDTEGRDPSRYVEGFLGTLEIFGGANGKIHIGFDESKPGGISLERYKFDSGEITVASIPAPSSMEDKEAILSSIILVENLQDFDLICMHHPIHTDDNLPYLHLNPKDLPISKRQIVLCGHIHNPPIDLPGNIIMPGSVARREAAEEDKPLWFVDLILSEDRSKSRASLVPIPKNLRVFSEQAKESLTEIKKQRESVVGELSTRLSIREYVVEAVSNYPENVQTVALSCFDEVDE